MPTPIVLAQPLGRPDFRFELRRYELAFAPGVFAAADESRDRVFPWMAWLHPEYTVKDTEAWAAHALAAWNEGTEFEFVIFDREDGRVAGACGLNQINRKDRVCNLGYWTRTSKARLGAATQAVALLTEFGFRHVGLNRIEIVVAESNHASRGVAEKSGAIYQGLQRARCCVGEKVHDAHLYTHVRPGL